MHYLQTVERGNEPADAFASKRLLRLRAKPLAICLSAVLATTASAIHASGVTPNHSAPQPQAVMNCGDSGPGSLREAVTQAQSGDTIDLTQLACSLITLTTGGEIVIQQDDLTILGPGKDSLTISGNNASRVFNIREPERFMSKR